LQGQTRQELLNLLEPMIQELLSLLGDQTTQALGQMKLEPRMQVVPN
jgi:hypothetical protein